MHVNSGCQLEARLHRGEPRHAATAMQCTGDRGDDLRSHEQPHKVKRPSLHYVGQACRYLHVYNGKPGQILKAFCTIGNNRHIVLAASSKDIFCPYSKAHEARHLP